MVNYNYLLFYHFVVMRGKYFNKVKNLKSGTEYFSDSITDESWNYFVPNDCYNLLVEENVKNGTYNLCIPSYLEGNRQLETIITSHPYDYTKISTETWFSKDKLIDVKYKDNYSILKVDSTIQKEEFINCFKSVYGQPQNDMNAYGGLANEYFKTLEDFDFFSDEIDGYILKVDNIVVSVCLVCNYGRYSGIYGLGTHPNYLGHGYGKYLLSVITNIYLKSNQSLFFQTETDSKVEGMYLKMGFSKLFTCDYYKRGDQYEE